MADTGEGTLDADASAKLDAILQAAPELDASRVMSAALRLWHAVATGRAHVVTLESEEAPTAH